MYSGGNRPAGSVVWDQLEIGLTAMRTRLPRAWAQAAVMVSLITVLTACETSPLGKAKGATPPPGAAPPQGLAIAPVQRFDDVPLPTGLREDMDKTFVFENDAIEIGRMVYNSKDSISDLAKFYLRECPAADWQHVSLTQAGHVEMLFTKPGRRLVVEIRDSGVTPGRELILLLTPDKE
jgi:hypothetical protein